MLKILDAQQTKLVDSATIKENGISSADLMERAALAIYETLLKHINPLSKVYIFAGTGNNGGDALSVARMLLASDMKPEVFLVGDAGKLSDECRQNLKRLKRLTPVYEIKHIEDIPWLDKDGVILDGLFGSGINRPLEGLYAGSIRLMNTSGCKIFSIDMPSGMFFGDNTENDNDAIVKASKVFSLQLPKLSLLLPDSSDFYEEFCILDIGLSAKAIEEQGTDFFLTEMPDVAKLIKPRSKFSHKGNFGHALLAVGSKGKTGAAVLSSSACLRAGVGLLTVHAPQCSLGILQTAVPEAMVAADASEEHISRIDSDTDKFTIGIGCGIGTAAETAQALGDLICRYRKPMVIDADALNIIAADDSLKRALPENSILTPHPLEFERLAGRSFRTGYERLQYARDFAADYKVFIVLKGAYTAVTTPHRQVFFNSTGNPGMATAGSGDVLTGILTSLLAQGYDSFQTALIGVYLHGLAGDIAAGSRSQYSMLASDIVDCLGEAYKYLENETDNRLVIKPIFC